MAVSQSVPANNSITKPFVLALLLSVVAALSACSDKPDAEEAAAGSASANNVGEISQEGGNPAPVSFSAETDDGIFNSVQHKGDVIYLDFWASWCGPCRESFPWMNEMLSKYEDKGLRIIGLSLDQDKNLARRFADEFNAEFTIGFDVNGAVADQFQVKGLPSSVIIDREGNLFESHTGFNEIQAKEFEASLVKALN